MPEPLRCPTCGGPMSQIFVCRTAYIHWRDKDRQNGTTWCEHCDDDSTTRGGSDER